MLDARVRTLRGGRDDVESPAAPLAPDVPGAGACVTIRLDGRPIGRGEALGGAAPLLAAAQSAIVEAVESLPGGGDALREQQRADALARAVVAVELAGNVTPLDIETYAQADELVRPGLDAVVLRWNGTLHGSFPARHLHAGDAPSRALVALIASASGDPGLPIAGVPSQEAKAVREKHRAGFARARVLHAVELTPGAAPIPAWRGGRLVGAQEVSAASIARARDAIVSHLARRTIQGPRGATLWTTLWPTQGRTDEARSSDLQTTMTAIALFAAAGASPAVPADGEAARIDFARAEAGPAQAATLARTLLGELAAREVAAGEGDAWGDPVLAAAWSVALSQWSRFEAVREKPWFERVRARVLAGLASSVAEQGADAEGFAWSNRSPRSARGLIALGLAHAERGQWASGAEQGAPDAAGAVRSIYREAPGGQLITHLPWVGYADLVLAGRARGAGAEREEDGKGGTGGLGAAPALREARATCWARQVTHEIAMRDGMDLQGGLMLAHAGAGTLPTWQSARPLALLAVMLRDQRLTDAKELLPEAGRLGAGLRFLMQLAVDESWTYCVADPAASLGGVRNAPWDQRQSLEAQAIVLLALSEAERALR
jgi:hypothetical protein